MNDIRRGVAVVGCFMSLAAAGVLTGPAAGADPNGEVPLPGPPSDSSLIRPLPVFTPIASTWVPKFPFPYDKTLKEVTPVDITVMGELCQWYNAQYVTLREQIERLATNRIDEVTGWDHDYSRADIRQQVDIVTGNLGQALDFLGPRVQSLTQAQNVAGDSYFPVYEGEAFFKLWEQWSNVYGGIVARQPNWFTGPSVHKSRRWGSDIHRSRVCDG